VLAQDPPDAVGVAPVSPSPVAEPPAKDVSDGKTAVVDTQKKPDPVPEETILGRAKRLHKPLVVDSIVEPQTYARIEPAIHLRSVQEEAIDAFFSTDLKRFVMAIPTGVGKSITGLAIAGRLNCRVLWIAHRDELIEQPAGEIRSNFPGLQYGIEKADDVSGGARVIIASIQTLQRTDRLITLLKGGPIGLVVYDECHHACSKSSLKVLVQLGCFEKNGPKLLGLTATVTRADKVSLSQVFDDVIYSVSIQEAIQMGFLVPPRALKVPLPLDPRALRVVNGDFSASDLDRELARTNCASATAAAISANCRDRKTIVFCVSVDQAKRTAEACSLLGIKARWASGMPHMSKGDRKHVLKLFSENKIDVVVCADLLTEGYNERSVSAVVIARPTRSQSRYIQMSGRGLRTCQHKVDCLLVDIVGATDFGFATSDILLDSDKKAKKPRKRTESSGDPFTEWSKIASYLRSAKVDIVEHGEITFARASADMLVTAAKDLDMVVLRRVGTTEDPGADMWQVEHRGKLYTFVPMALQEAMTFCDSIMDDFGGGVKPGSPEWNEATLKPTPIDPVLKMKAAEGIPVPHVDGRLPIALPRDGSSAGSAVNGASLDEIAEKIDQDVVASHVQLFAEGIKLAMKTGRGYVFNFDRNPPPNPHKWGWETTKDGRAVASAKDKTMIGWIRGDLVYVDPDSGMNLAKTALREAGKPDDIKLKHVRRFLGTTKRMFRTETKEWIRMRVVDLDQGASS
jgi:superfamily II DNA or RNA helicase